ncbi:MAG: hypothetical protein ACM3O9_09690 [Methylocystaceae bacterium]
MILQEEITRMNWYMIESTSKWHAELAPIVQDLQTNRHWQALPYHTMALNRTLGSSIDDAARMGSIFRLFVLSDHIHALVKDDNEGQVYDSALQFHILIGDLLYGCALGLLCERGWDNLMPLIANMIVAINEGHSLAWAKPVADPFQLATLEWGSYYRTAFSIAGLINNLQPDMIKKLDVIGLDLGLSIVKSDVGPVNARVDFTRFQEGMNALLSNLSVNNNYQRLDNWLAGTSLWVPAAG